MVEIENKQQSEYEQKIPRLILLRGLPGVGKSTVANEIVSIVGNKTCKIIDPDLVDMESEEYKDFKANLICSGVKESVVMYRYLLDLTYQGLCERKNIIWTQAWTKIWGIESTVNKLEGTVIFKPLIVTLNADKNIVESRIENRKRLLTNRELTDFIASFEDLEETSLVGIDRHCFNTMHLQPFEVAERVINLFND